MSDLANNHLSYCSRTRNSKMHPLTNQEWFMVETSDVSKLRKGREIMVEIIGEGKKVIFAGFGQITNTSLFGDSELTLTSFNDDHAKKFLHLPRYTPNLSSCDPTKTCVINISKKASLKSGDNKIQIFQVKNSDQQTSVLLYLSCQYLTGGKSRIIRKKRNIIKK